MATTIKNSDFVPLNKVSKPVFPPESIEKFIDDLAKYEHLRETSVYDRSRMEAHSVLTSGQRITRVKEGKSMWTDVVGNEPCVELFNKCVTMLGRDHPWIKQLSDLSDRDYVLQRSAWIKEVEKHLGKLYWDIDPYAWDYKYSEYGSTELASIEAGFYTPRLVSKMIRNHDWDEWEWSDWDHWWMTWPRRVRETAQAWVACTRYLKFLRNPIPLMRMMRDTELYLKDLDPSVTYRVMMSALKAVKIDMEARMKVSASLPDIPEKKILEETQEQERKDLRIIKSLYKREWYPWQIKIRQKIFVDHRPSCPLIVEQLLKPEEMTRTYWDDLPALFEKIGRPDLAMNCCAPIRFEWIRRKQVQNMAQIRRWEPQGGDCPRKKDYRVKANRILTQYLTVLRKHLDKMLVLSHRGRFAYLKHWDMALFQKQRQSIMSMDAGILQQQMNGLKNGYLLNDIQTAVPHIPVSYVEECEKVIEIVNRSVEEQKPEDVWQACKAVSMMVCRWHVHDQFEVAKVKPICMEPQSDDKPVVKSSGGGGSPAGAKASSGGPTQPEEVSKPITSGDKKVNITMVDQREVQKAVVPKQPKSVPHKEEVNEQAYKLLDLVKRPMFIDRISWTTSDEFGKSLRTWVIPGVYFNAASASKTVCQSLNAAYVLSMYGLTKFDVKVRVQINSVKFQQGLLICVFQPWCASDKSDDVFNNYCQYPHVKIDASVSNTAEMLIPFTNIRDYFPIYTDPNAELTYFGQFKVRVWNPLRTGATGSTDTSISVWMWLENIEVYQQCNPKPPDKVIFADSLIGYSNLASDSSSEILKIQGQKYKPDVRTWQPEALEGVMEVAGPMVADLGAQLVESLLQKVARGGNDKPNGPHPPKPMMPRVVGNTAHGDGLDTSQRLSLTSVSVTRPDKNIKGPTNFKDLLKEWSRIKVIEWDTTQAENTSLWSTSVLPMKAVSTTNPVNTCFYWKYLNNMDGDKDCAQTSKVEAFSVLERQGSMLDFIGRSFYYWSGTLKWKIEIVCTGMHSGRLLIRYEPFGSEKTAQLECQKMATPGIIWDVQEKHELEFETPYMSTQPFLNSRALRDNESTASFVTTESCGIIELTIVNRLKVTTGISSGVSINVYVAAGEDFEFAVPAPLEQVIGAGSDSKPTPYKDACQSMEHRKHLWEALDTYLVQQIKNRQDTELILINKDKKEYNLFMLKRDGGRVRAGPITLAGRSKVAYLGNVGRAIKEVIKSHSITVFARSQWPKFESYEEAFHWMMVQPKRWPSRLQKEPYTWLGKWMSDKMYERLMAWFAYAALLEEAWTVAEMPDSKIGHFNLGDAQVYMDLFSELVDVTPKWHPQSNDGAQGNFLNPFKGNTQKQNHSKEVFGESFMDMYKIMKRYSPWRTMTFPFDYSMTTDEKFAASVLPTLADISAMTQFERKNFVFETCIPVTPMLPQHRIGEHAHNFVSINKEGWQQYSKANRLIWAPSQGGLNTSSQATITKQHWYGQVHTFWKGSLRWKFIFPEARDGSSDPWWCAIVYLPRVFTTPTFRTNNSAIVNGNRMRDAMSHGMLLYEGNVMGSLEVETPYYSRFNRLYASSEMFNEFTTAGSIAIFTPIRYAGPANCKWTDLKSTDDVVLGGLTSWIFQAVGDDFEYQIKRPAPVYFLWAEAWHFTPSSTEHQRGFDHLANLTSAENVMVGQHSDHPRAVVKEVSEVNELHNPIRNITKLMPTGASKQVDEKIEIAWKNYYPVKRSLWEPQNGEVAGPSTASDEVDGMMDAMKALPSVMKDFHETVGVAKDTLKAITESVALASEAITTVKVGSEKVTEGIVETTKDVSGLVNYAINGTRIVVFFKGLLECMRAETWSDRWFPIATCALALGLPPESVTKAGEWLCSSIGSLFGSSKVPENRKPQSWESTWNEDIGAFLDTHGDVLKIIAAAIATLATFYMTSSAPQGRSVVGFATSAVNKLRNFAFVGAGLKTMEWMFKWIATTVKDAFMWVADLLSGGLLNAKRMSSHYPEVLEWLQKVEKYSQDEVQMQLSCDVSARLELWRLMDEGTQLIGKLSAKQGSLYNTLTRGMLKLQQAHDKMLITKQLIPFREDPFHVCLVGGVGVHKSTILQQLMGFAGDQLDLPKTNRFYARNEDDEYWTDYQGQPIVIIDDIGQDKKGRAMKEMIKMKTNNAWSLNMAKLEEKGRCFISKIIGSTTNVMFPKPDDINVPQALWRRRNMLIEVRRVGVGTSLTGLRFDILEPCPQGSEMRQVIRGDLTMAEVMVIMVQAMKEYLTVQRSLVFANLQGREFTLPQYDQEEVIVGEQTAPVETFDTFKRMVKAKLPISDDMMDLVWAQMKEEEYRALQADAVLYGRAREYPRFCKFETNRFELLTTWNKLNFVKSQTPEDLPRTLAGMAMAGILKEEETDAGKVYVPIIDNEVCRGAFNATVIPVNGEERVTLHYRPQAFELDELLEDTEVYWQKVRDEADELKREAQRSVVERNTIMNGFESVVEQVGRQRIPRGQKISLASDEEIRKYVDTTFPEIRNTSEKEELVQQLKNFYNRVKTANLSEVQQANKDSLTSQYVKLFSAENNKYWTKINDDGKMRWKFSIPEEEAFEDEKLMELTTLYAVMVEDWGLDKIDETKNADPTVKVSSSWITSISRWMEHQKKKIDKWFEEHPWVTKMLKVGAAIAALFLGYKVLSMLAPDLLGKLTAGMAAVFGFGIKHTVGEEYVERVREKGKAVGATVKRKTAEWYAAMRSLMIGTKDPELIEMSTDDGKVEMFGEEVEKTATMTKHVVKCRANLSPEARTRMVSAYYAGQTQMHPEDRERIRAPMNKNVGWDVQQARMNPEGANDPTAATLRQNVLASNMCRLSWAKPNGKTNSLSGVFVRGRTMLMPAHFWENAEEGLVFTIVLPNGIMYYDTFKPKNCVQIPGHDACVYECGLRVGQFKDITKHFIPRSELNFQTTASTLNLLTPSGVLVVWPNRATLVKDVEYDLSGGTHMTNVVAWEYEADTVPGDCGAILMADNSAVRAKFLGIHTCGDKTISHGSATLVFQEDLQMAISALPETTAVKATNYIPECLITGGIEQMKVQPVGNFELCGTVSPSKAVRLPHKTEILPSAIHDMVRKHVSEPAVLTRVDPRLKENVSPLLKALNKYGTPTLPFPPKDLDYVASAVQSEVLSWKVPMEKRKLTDWEAVFGNEMIDYCDRMNLNASPGYPYVLTRPSGEKGKAYLFDINSVDGIADDNYRAQYQLREKLGRVGIRKMSLWTDCLKDERRPLHKIESGSTRAFMLPPADYVQLCRKYFMAFAVCFYSNCVKSFSAVGIDPYSYQWTQLVREWRKKSNLMFGGDFHAFDGIFDPDFMEKFIKIINERYKVNGAEDWTPEDDVMRAVLMEEAIHTVHICLNSIYVKHQGNPSGNPLTVILNTLAHFFYLLLAWIGIARELCPEMMSLYWFFLCVCAKIYGDDGAYSVMMKTAEWFNFASVAEFLARFGIEYTDELKSGAKYSVRRMTECSFLKNTFRKLEGHNYWLAPIAVDTIYELTNWVRKSDDPVRQLRENLEDAFKFAFHHGREFFDRFLLDVNTALRVKGLKESAQSYDHQLEQFLAKCRS